MFHKKRMTTEKLKTSQNIDKILITAKIASDLVQNVFYVRSIIR